MKVLSTLHLILFAIVFLRNDGRRYLVSSLQFEYPDFRNHSLITLVQKGSWYQGDNPIIVDSAIWLTPLITSSDTNLGRMIYSNPVSLVRHSLGNGKNSSASFNRSFSFQIECTTGIGKCGSGMAFFISTSKQAPEDSIGAGLVYTVTTQSRMGQGSIMCSRSSSTPSNPQVFLMRLQLISESISIPLCLKDML
ncbi:hypothetical protein KP509_15G033800 [Ceratopteris richardii]|uniref:Legume lectin domain-containing protein n=1 Tax=Ceratopteris richardii TaxID=49495 RepID=A0A8T2T4E8_CERRI|nr:hypothetical protein KP509_15G033800 [Ceratopteris richardii]